MKILPQMIMSTVVSIPRNTNTNLAQVSSKTTSKSLPDSPGYRIFFWIIIVYI
jgi:hypothetical protein